MRFSERYANVPVVKPADHQNGVDGDAIHMGKVHSVAYSFLFGSITGDSVLKFYVGATATKTTAIAFKYRLSGADQGSAGADQFGDATSVASSGLTLAAAAFDNRHLIVEIDSQAIPDATPWLTPEIDATASVLFVSCSAICQPRYGANDPLTVIS